MIPPLITPVSHASTAQLSARAGHGPARMRVATSPRPAAVRRPFLLTLFPQGIIWALEPPGVRQRPPRLAVEPGRPVVQVLHPGPPLRLIARHPDRGKLAAQDPQTGQQPAPARRLVLRPPPAAYLRHPGQPVGEVREQPDA